MADIPNVAGVPTLLTDFNPASPSGLTFLTADTVTGLGGQIAPWGIYSGGAPVIAADTVIALDYRQDWVLCDYPLEQGAFETYDKVATPYDVRVRFVCGGNDGDRAAFLASVAAIAGDYNLYDVVTPEAVYTSLNVRHYDYHRSPNRGLGLLTVDVWLLQVRIQGVTGQTAMPWGAAAVAGGIVAATAATAAIAAVADGFF